MKGCERILCEDAEHFVNAYAAHIPKHTREIVLCSYAGNPELIEVERAVFLHNLRCPITNKSTNESC